MLNGECRTDYIYKMTTEKDDLQSLSLKEKESLDDKAKNPTDSFYVS
ncbi:hypothetical protein B1no1_22240 [Thermolongibacillus altinsuensis]|nr:hypothetical protein B1no1_22240 [Thermolongibacillus altinsuensis]